MDGGTRLGIRTESGWRGKQNMVEGSGHHNTHCISQCRLAHFLLVVQRKLLSLKNKLSLCSLFIERPVMKSLKTQRRIYNQLHRRSYVQAATLFLALLLLLFQG